MKCNHFGGCPAARPATRPATSGLTFGRASGSCSGHGAAAFRPRAGRRSGLVRPRGRTPVPDTCPAIRLAFSARARLRVVRCQGSTPSGVVSASAACFDGFYGHARACGQVLHMPCLPFHPRDPNPAVCLCVRLSVGVSVCLCLYLSVCSSVCLFVCLSVCLSVRLSV